MEHRETSAACDSPRIATDREPTLSENGRQQ